MEDLKQKLANEVDQADWDMLRIHHQNHAVYLVLEDLLLLDVAVAIAQDKVSFVKIWLDNQQLRRPTDKEVQDYEKSKFAKNFEFIILQPYVLIKKVK